MHTSFTFLFSREECLWKLARSVCGNFQEDKQSGMGCLFFSWIRNESHRLFSVMTQSCGVLGKKQRKEKVFWWRPVRGIKAPGWRTGIRRERWTVVGLWKDNKLAVLVNA